MAKKQNPTAPASDNPKNDPQTISSSLDNVGAINERPVVVPAKS